MKTINIYLYTLSFILLSNKGFTQDSTSVAPKVTISGYADIYYSYDFGNPSTHERPSFLYNHNRHNEVNLNLGFIKAAYSSAGIRANVALMAGTYAQYNLAAEQGLLKNIYEANAGFSLSKKRTWWVDAGIFASHIGFESAISKDCWNLTRSILAENSPYYESGAKITYASQSGKLTVSGMVLNGWQRIARMPGNNTPAVGTQVIVKPNDKILFNSSTFIGNEKPDSAMQMRYFHNYYGIFQITPKWGVTTGFDIGIQQAAKGSNIYYTWYSPVLITRFLLTEKLAVAGRAEYYNDSKGVIIATATPNGFQTFGYSLNLDYMPVSNMSVRLEGRMLDSRDKIFILDNNPSNQNFFITSSIAVSF